MVLRLLVFLLAAGFGLRHWQFEHHLQAMWQHIFGGNAALVLLDDVLGNRQAQACAIAGAAAVGAEKCGEDVWQLGFVYAHAIVGDVDQQLLFVEAAIDVDDAALRAVFDGIAQNIVKSLIQITFIGTNDDGFFTGLQLQ